MILTRLGYINAGNSKQDKLIANNIIEEMLDVSDRIGGTSYRIQSYLIAKERYDILQSIHETEMLELQVIILKSQIIHNSMQFDMFIKLNGYVLELDSFIDVLMEESAFFDYRDTNKNGKSIIVVGWHCDTIDKRAFHSVHTRFNFVEKLDNETIKNVKREILRDLTPNKYLSLNATGLKTSLIHYKRFDVLKKLSKDLTFDINVKKVKKVNEYTTLLEYTTLVNGCSVQEMVDFKDRITYQMI